MEIHAELEALEEAVEESVPKSEWLSFRLANLDYGVDILRVREIRRWEPSTRIPYSPIYIIGLINLRGAIVPIVNLRMRLGMEPKEYDAETVILILDVELDSGTRTMGIIVDAISDVIAVKDKGQQNTANFDLAIEKGFVSGITEDNGAMVILLNIDAMLDLPI